MKGKWGHSSVIQKTNFFEFKISTKMPATLHLTFSGEAPRQHEVLIDFKQMQIENGLQRERLIDEFSAIEAVDTAQLIFFILQPDVTAIEHNNDLKIQAKLKSIGEEDINSNGQGVTRSSLTLYNVSEYTKKQSKEDGNKIKKKKNSAVKEPKDRTLVEFYLN